MVKGGSAASVRAHRLVIAQGDIWWTDLGEPIGSAPGYIRPVLVIQSDALNVSALRTVVCVPLTGTSKLARLPGNVMLPAAETGLDRDSVANVSQITTVDKDELRDHTGRVARRTVEKILSGIDIVLGR